MLSYCLKFKKDAENVDPKVLKTRNGRTMYLKQTRLTYGACGLFYINKKLIKKFMQTENTNYIYRNNLGQACFQHDIAFT